MPELAPRPQAYAQGPAAHACHAVFRFHSAPPQCPSNSTSRHRRSAATNHRPGSTLSLLGQETLSAASTFGSLFYRLGVVESKVPCASGRSFIQINYESELLNRPQDCYPAGRVQRGHLEKLPAVDQNQPRWLSVAAGQQGGQTQRRLACQVLGLLLREQSSAERARSHPGQQESLPTGAQQDRWLCPNAAPKNALAHWLALV